MIRSIAAVFSCCCPEDDVGVAFSPRPWSGYTITPYGTVIFPAALLPAGDTSTPSGPGPKLSEARVVGPGPEVPVSGQVAQHVPARRLMFTALERWVRDFRLDGLRLDSVETVANWDFVGEVSARTRAQFVQQSGLRAEADARFLVIGEELAP